MGTVDLIRDDNIPPLKWSIGRVIEIHVGADNQVCVATVKTAMESFNALHVIYAHYPLMTINRQKIEIL